MIELVRSDTCKTCDEVSTRLRELSVAHQVVAAVPGTDAHHVIREGDRIVAGNDLPPYLEELTRVIHDWNRFQSDACFVEDDGRIC
jgi:hypothetical protein